MARRKKHQSIDFVIGALKKIALDKKQNARTRLEAVDRMALIDSIYRVDLNPPRRVGGDGGPPPDWINKPKPEDQGPDVDTLIAQMEAGKAKQAETQQEGACDISQTSPS